MDPATGTAPSFAGTAPTLQPGFHILYAYATDAQDATAIWAGTPMVSNIQAYGFLFISLSSVTINSSPRDRAFRSAAQIAGRHELHHSNDAAMASGCFVRGDVHESDDAGQRSPAGVYRLGRWRNHRQSAHLHGALLRRYLHGQFSDAISVHHGGQSGRQAR